MGWVPLYHCTRRSLDGNGDPLQNVWFLSLPHAGDAVKLSIVLAINPERTRSSVLRLPKPTPACTMLSTAPKLGVSLPDAP